MSKTTSVLLLTDLHFRSDYLPGFLETQVETLLKLADSSKPDAVVINGDIFHKRNPRGPELLAFGELLSKLPCNNIIVNRGNHDTIRKDGTSDTTLSLFADKAQIITEAKTVRIGGVDFDFIPHYEDESKIVECLKKSNRLNQRVHIRAMQGRIKLLRKHEEDIKNAKSKWKKRLVDLLLTNKEDG